MVDFRESLLSMNIHWICPKNTLSFTLKGSFSRWMVSLHRSPTGCPFFDVTRTRGSEVQHGRPGIAYTNTFPHHLDGIFEMMACESNTLEPQTDQNTIWMLTFKFTSLYYSESVTVI